MFRSRTTLIMLLVTASLTLSACDSPDEKQAKYIDRGNALFSQGEFKKARLEYKNAARIKPSDAQVRYRLGLVDEAEGDLRSSFGNFIAAEQQDAHFHPALKRLTQYFLAGEQYAEAQKRVDTLLLDLPNDPDAHALRAALSLRQKDFEGAEKEARQALALEANNVTAYTVLTGLYVAQNDQAKAGATVEEAIARNPQTLSLLLLKAMIYEKEENVDKIAEAYKLIFQLKPTDARFRDDLAKVYTRADKKDEAEVVLREGVSKAPDNWSMKHKLVQFLNDARGLDAAEKEIRLYMQAFPDYQDLYFWLADLYISNKATDRAIALLEQMVDHSKDAKGDKYGLNAQTSLARIHFVKGNRQLAEKLSLHVLEMDPNNKEALFIKAQMLVDQGSLDEGVAVLRTIVRDNPQATDALQLMAEILVQQGRIDLAVDTLSQLVDVAPTNVPAQIRLAQMLAARGEEDRALSILELVTKMDPTYAVGWESMARIAIEAKKWELADKAIATLGPMEKQGRTVLFLRAQVAVAQGSYDQAVQNYKQIISEAPTAPIATYALTALAEAMLKMNQMAAFVSYLEAVPARTPLMSSFLGEAYVKLHEPAKAALAFDQALADGAPSPAAYLERARLYASEKKVDEATALLAKASQAFPMDKRADLMSADLFSGVGKHKEAMELYDKLLAQAPNNDRAANNLASLIADHMANDATALARAGLLAERFIRSTNPYFLDTLAWVYFRQGKSEQAQTIFERIMGYGQELPPAIHYHYGALLLGQGKKAEAKAELEKAISAKEPFTGLEEARKMSEGL